MAGIPPNMLLGGDQAMVIVNYIPDDWTDARLAEEFEE